jgi:hypothetical protein
MAWFSRGRSEAYGSNQDHLRDELHRIAGLVRAQLLRFRLACPEAQRERFWHLPDDYIEELAREEERPPLPIERPPGEAGAILRWVEERRTAIDRRRAASGKLDLRLPRLASEFVLSSIEVDALLLALLPALHSTYRRWYGVMQLDAAKSFPSVGLLTEMLATSDEDYAGLLAALGPAGALARARLLLYGGTSDEPMALRAVAVDDRVTGFLFGLDGLDPALEQVARWFAEPVDARTLPITGEVANRLEMLPNLRAAEPDFLPRLRLAFLGPDPGLAVRAFAAVAAGLGKRPLVMDVPAALASPTPWPVLIDCVLRDARLGGGLPLFAGIAGLYEHGESTPRLEQLLHRLAGFPQPAAIDLGVISGEEGRTPAGWIPFRLPAPTIAMREKLWSALLAGGAHGIPESEREAVARDLANAFQLTDSQVRESWSAAEGLARRRNVFIASVDRSDLFAACREQSAKRLVAFAQRLEPRGALTLEHDLILPPANKRALYELRARVRNHGRMHGAMELGAHLRLGRGVTALFIGGSGTGKTMAAEVLASEHQIDLYRIDLAALVSKWVGETPKNLSRIFADAERANCMLFFDEADAVFGHRGKVEEARDRWANLEVNYLLQRIEEYSGVVILATNLRQNIDDAFHRRLHCVVEFPPPDAGSRLEIWQRLLPRGEHNRIPAEDLNEVAQRFLLTGGNIRNVVLDACYRVLERGQDTVTTREVIAGTAREYQKTSRPVTRGDFGRFYDWAMEDVIAPGSSSAAGA